MLSAVVRDHTSVFVFAWTAKVGTMDHGVAQAQACCFGLSEAIKLGLSDIILEGDVSTVLDPLSDWSTLPHGILRSLFLMLVLCLRMCKLGSLGLFLGLLIILSIFWRNGLRTVIVLDLSQSSIFHFLFF